MIPAVGFSPTPSNVSIDPVANKIGNSPQMKINFWELLAQVQEPEFLIPPCLSGQSCVAITVFSCFWNITVMYQLMSGAEDGNF